MNRRHLSALALVASATIATTAVATTTSAGGSTNVHITNHHAAPAPLPALLASVAIPKASTATPTWSDPSTAIQARTAQVQRQQQAVITFAVAEQNQKVLAFATAVANAKAAQAQAAAAAAARAPQGSTAVASANPSAGIAGLSGFLACVAFRESRNDPTAVNPSSGAGGLFQFLPSTWANLGEPGLPENAPVSVQIAAAEKLMSMEGTSPWAGGGYSC